MNTLYTYYNKHEKTPQAAGFLFILHQCNTQMNSNYHANVEKQTFLFAFFQYFSPFDRYNTMDFLNMDLEQLNKGSLNGRPRRVGIGDIDIFVNQFRNQANQEAVRSHHASGGQYGDVMSIGRSFLNQVC